MRLSIHTQAGASPNAPAIEQQHDSVLEHGPANLRALTGLRFLAAALVVCYHLRNYMPSNFFSHFMHGIFMNVFSAGYVSVPFFFVLSGFILAYNYLVRPRLNVRSFWLARIARIYPVYVLAFLLAAAPYTVWSDCAQQMVRPLCVSSQPVVTGLASLALVQAWIPSDAAYWNITGWSLSVEMFCYLLFPLLAVFVLRLSQRQLIVLAAAAWAISMGLSLCFLGASAGGWHNTFSDTPSYLMLDFFQYNPLVHLPDFVIGMAAGRLYLLRPRHPATWFSNPITMGWASTLSLALCGSVLAVSPAIPWIVLHNSLLLPAFAGLIFTTARGHGPVAWLFGLPFVVLLGGASYALYLLHLPIFKIMEHYRAMIPVGTLAFAVFLCALLLLASIAAFKFIEEPARRAIRRLPLAHADAQALIHAHARIIR